MIEICPHMPLNKNITIVICNDLAPIRREAIIWSNSDNALPWLQGLNGSIDHDYDECEIMIWPIK